MRLSNTISEAIKMPPAKYATRIVELTPYEKIIKYALEMRETYNTGDAELIKSRFAAQDGHCSRTNFTRYLDVFVKPSTFELTRTARTQILDEMLSRLVDAGFFELGFTEKKVPVYKLTDLYKSKDVNELIEG